jgi:tetratricopeptide (TPR) repeat protein
LLGTYRDVAAAPLTPLGKAIRDLDREHLLKRLALHHLSPEGSAAFLAAVLRHALDDHRSEGQTLEDQGHDQEQGYVSEAVAELVYGQSEGNPFFAQAVARTLLDRGDVYRADETATWERRERIELVVPEGVRGLIHERVARLAQPTQEVLKEASVLGQAFAFGDLQAMGGRSELEVEEALEEALSAHVVQEEARADAYTFDHALTQQALYGELSARRRRRLHRVAGEAVERLAVREREARVAELAYHFGAAGEAARALPYALQAGAQAEAVYAHAQAQRHYHTALELARDVSDQAREAEALEGLGRVLHTHARFEEALALCDQALEAYRMLRDQEGMRRVLACYGQCCGSAGTPKRGIARLEPLLDSLETNEPSSGLAQLYLALAFLYSTDGKPEEGLATADKALALAERANDTVTLVAGKCDRGWTLFLGLGRHEEAEHGQEEVIAQAEAIGDLRTESDALALIGCICSRRCDFTAARRHFERAVDVAERLADPNILAIRLCQRGEAAFFLGDWAQTDADWTRADVLLRQIGSSLFSLEAPASLGEIRMYQGRWEEASRHLESAIALAERKGNVLQLLNVQTSYAAWELLEGRSREAQARLLPLFDERGGYEIATPTWLAILAWTYLELGDEARAETLVQQSLARARARSDQLGLAFALQVKGRLAIRQRRWQEAMDALEEALRDYRAMPCPHHEAAVLYIYGQLHVAMAEPQQARHDFEMALAICERLGEGLYRPHIERALAAVAQGRVSRPMRPAPQKSHGMPPGR